MLHKKGAINPNDEFDMSDSLKDYVPINAEQIIQSDLSEKKEPPMKQPTESQTKDAVSLVADSFSKEPSQNPVNITCHGGYSPFDLKQMMAECAEEGNKLFEGVMPAI